MELGGELNEAVIKAQRDIFLTQLEYIYTFFELANVSPTSKIAGHLFSSAMTDLVRNLGVTESEKIISELPRNIRLQIAIHITGLTREPYLSST